METNLPLNRGSLILSVFKSYALGFALCTSVPVSSHAQLAWQQIESGTLADLYSIRAGADGSVYAAGSGTTVIEYNGDSWSGAAGWNTTDFTALSQAQWVNQTIRSLGVDNNGQVYVGTPADSRMAIYNPTTGTWTQYDPFSNQSPTNAAQMAIANTESGVILVQPRSNNQIGIWQNPTGGTQTNPNIREVVTGGANNYTQTGGASATGLNNMWVAATYNGKGRLVRGTGTTANDWMLINPEAGVTMEPVWRSVHAVSESFVVVGGQGPGSSGESGLVGFWESSDPTVWQELGYWSDNIVLAVYADAADSVWAAGLNSSTNENFLAFYNGSAWNEVDLGGFGGIYSLTKDSEGAIWAAGAAGQIYMGVIPEPTSIALLGGALLFGFFRWGTAAVPLRSRRKLWDGSGRGA